jgi:hypothetical protein
MERLETPSMRMAVKPHQAFFLAARTDHAAGLVPLSRRLPALLPSILSPPPSPHPRLGEGGGERMLLNLHLHAVRGAVQAWRQRFWPAGVRLGPGARPERPSIRVRPATAPSTLYRYTPRASGTPRIRAHPSNERCLRRFTRRHNGGPLRPRLHHPQRRRPRVLLFEADPLPSSTRLHTVAAAASWACRRAVELTRSRQSFSSAPAGTSPSRR